MLISLTVENIALIGRETVEFGRGLHVLTGETGAGKSLIVDAMGLLLGGRAAKEMIRTGEEKARVEGIFDLSDAPDVKSALAALNEDAEGETPESGEEDTLILSREIFRSGRSVCRVNGMAVPLSLYATVTKNLMDLHGQHAHQSLMDDKTHIRFLDGFGDQAHQGKRRETAEAYAVFHEKDRALEKLQKKAREKQDREDVLKLQLRELKSAHLKAGEEEALEKERDRFKNSGKISSALQEAYQTLYTDPGAAVARLREAADSLRRVTSMGDEFAALHERAMNAYYEAEDISLTIQGILDESGADPEREEQVMSRLDLIRRLSRRYGATTKEMLEKLARVEAELKTLQSLDEAIAQAEDERKQAKKRYDLAAESLCASREALAARFEQAVESQLKDLNMAGSRFLAALEKAPPGPDGGQQCRFLIAANRGDGPQSLSHTASGGELSRLMLAIKAAAADQSPIPSMVFDEIDTGISGRAAQVTAEKMAGIARTHQVLCVTHLQQIAAMADRQYLVEKKDDGERTNSSIRLLKEEERPMEVARMLGGDAKSAEKHAIEMLKSQEEWKKQQAAKE